MLNAILGRWFAPKPQQGQTGDLAATAKAVYGSIVAQARQPGFYAACGVPDTPTGRYEMIMAHAVLVFRRLKQNDDLKDVSQAVFDLFFADMDRSLRELGVGDLSVPKQIKKMGQAFYGRAAAYTEALDGGNEAELAQALSRNVLSGADKTPLPPPDAARIAAYMVESGMRLHSAATDSILSGTIDWPQAPGNQD